MWPSASVTSRLVPPARRTFVANVRRSAWKPHVPRILLAASAQAVDDVSSRKGDRWPANTVGASLSGLPRRGYATGALPATGAGGSSTGVPVLRWRTSTSERRRSTSDRPGPTTSEPLRPSPGPMATIAASRSSIGSDAPASARPTAATSPSPSTPTTRVLGARPAFAARARPAGTRPPSARCSRSPLADEAYPEHPGFSERHHASTVAASRSPGPQAPRATANDSRLAQATRSLEAVESAIPDATRTPT